MQQLIRSAVVSAVAGATVLTAVPAHAGSEDYTGGALARQLAGNGHHFSQVFDGTEYPDYGLTLDGVLALDATGVGQGEAAAARSYVASHVYEYAGAWPEAYSGATAKALVANRAQGQGNVMGGLNLVQRLKALENRTTGRFSDKSQFGDYSNTFGQSLALIGYRMAGVAQTTRSVLFLKKQQCPNGGFRIEMAATTCTSNAQVDVDATAIAIQGLYATKADKYRTQRIASAAAFLAGRQNADGSLTGEEGTGNANTTGLAALSFMTAGRKTEAAKARGFLTGVTYGCGFPAPARGLVAYDQARYDAAEAQGAAMTVTDQDRRGSVQAALGLSRSSLRYLTKTGAVTAQPTLPC